MKIKSTQTASFWAKENRRLRWSQDLGSRGLQGEPTSAKRGVALIIALAMLALITAMFLGYTASMKTVNMSGKSYNELVGARALAEGAVESAMSVLGTHSPTRSSTKMWNSGPGVIYYNNNGTWTTNYLFQKTPTGLDVGTNGLLSNTNQSSFPYGINQGDIFPDTYQTTNAKIDVYWYNFGVDPSTNIQTNSNPLGYRIGTWIDDESSKINMNAAILRNTNQISSAQQISLTGLLTTNTTNTGWNTTNGTGEADGVCDAIYSAGCGTTVPPTTNGFPDRQFETLQELLRATNITTTNYGYNKSSMTVYSYDDNKNFAGVLRRDLSTNAGTNPLTKANDITATTGTNSLYSFLSGDASANTPFSLLFPTGQVAAAYDTFSEKYGTTNLKQIIANVIDYQTTNTVDSTYSALDATAINGVARNTPNDGGWLGLRKSPYINEILVDSKCQVTGTALAVQVRVRFELINPFNVALGGGELAAHLGAWPTIARRTGLGSVTAQPTFATAVKTIAVPAANVGANSYAVYEVVWSSTVDGTVTAAVTAATTFDVTVTLDNVRYLATAGTANTIRDFGGPPLQTFAAIVADSNQNAVNYGTARSLQRNDPRVRKYGIVADTGTPSAINTGATGATGFNTTAAGTSDNGSLLPGPTPPTALVTDFMASTPSTMGGATMNVSSFWIAESPMKSIGELGFIHTGYQWRTLRLLPRTGAEITNLVIPDWVMLDLVRIGNLENDTANHLVNGRMNINQMISADTTAMTGGPAPAIGYVRSRPLVALLSGWANGGNLDGVTAGTHMDYDLVNYGTNTTFGFPGFDSIGEICEVTSLQKGATSAGAPAHKGDQEEVIRGIANNITVRSNIFTVWAIAQTVQDVNKDGLFTNGLDVVLSEQKLMAVVERYEDTAGTHYRIRHMAWQ